MDIRWWIKTAAPHNAIPCRSSETAPSLLVGPLAARTIFVGRRGFLCLSFSQYVLVTQIEDLKLSLRRDALLGSGVR